MTDNEDASKINEHIDHQRWLLEHGFVNDLHKDNLFMYGSIVHKEIVAVQVDVNIEKKIVEYDLYITQSLLKRIARYEEMSKATSVIGLWRFKRLLGKEGNLNLKHLLSQFVNDYCGPKWSVSVRLKDIEGYEEGFKEQEQGDDALDKQLNEG